MAFETTPNYSSSINLQEPLREGLRLLSGKQSITFTKYIQQILPADGFVFWIRSDQLIDAPLPHVLRVEGSLHESINQEMLEDETPAVTSIIFSTMTEIDDLKVIDNNTLWLGEYNDSLFSFNRLGGFYEQAQEFHYMGDAVLPAFYSQIIDDINNLDLTNPVISNSTPFWLLLGVDFPIYPSYLVPTNLRPPYAVVDIDNQKPLNARPQYDDTQTSTNHIYERAELTLYGIRHNEAIDFVESIELSHFIDGFFGIMNIPIIKDEKRPQSEINTVAMKKTITFEINYQQKRLRDLALKLVQNINVNLTTRF